MPFLDYPIVVETRDNRFCPPNVYAQVHAICSVSQAARRRDGASLTTVALAGIIEVNLADVVVSLGLDSSSFDNICQKYIFKEA